MSKELAEKLLEFLNGSAPLDGVFFDEPHPTHKGKFWWRQYLPILRAEPASGQLSAEEIDSILNANKTGAFLITSQEIDALCDMALSSLRGTFADGIEAAKVCDELEADPQLDLEIDDGRIYDAYALSLPQASQRIRALAQGQRSEAENIPIGSDADASVSQPVQATGQDEPHPHQLSADSSQSSGHQTEQSADELLQDALAYPNDPYVLERIQDYLARKEPK